MLLHLTNALERDCDLLLIRQFTFNNKVRNLFFNKANLKDYAITDIYHSYHSIDENGYEGESDIVIKLRNGDKNIILCIEDKINAIAMPNQYQRYKNRCEKEFIKNGYDEYYLFIFCSKKYYEENNEAKKYDFHVYYEELIAILNEDNYLFDSQLLELAINKSKSYQVIEDENKTMFWNSLYKYIGDNYKNSNFIYNDNSNKAKGSNSFWFSFLTNIKGVSIIAKMNKGYVDLTFNKMGNSYYQLKDFIKRFDNSLIIVKTTNSCAIRFYNNVIDMNKSFESQIVAIDKILTNVIKCYEIVEKLNKLGVKESPFDLSKNN